MYNFSDQVVLITGAAGNLGSAVAAGFRQAGARLVLMDLRLEKLEAAYGSWENVLLLPADLTNEESINQAVAQAIDEMQQIHILANIAGGFTMGTPVHETSIKTWDFMLNLNARSLFFMSRAIVPQMVRQNWGKIINVAARAGLSGGANLAAYSVSKSAVIRLTESMSAELKDYNINVNCVMPGTIDTPQNRASMPNADWNRWVTPEAIANLFLFLASDLASAIQGAAIPVYGKG